MSAQDPATPNASAETQQTSAVPAVQAAATEQPKEIPSRVLEALKSLPDTVLKRIGDKGEYDKTLLSELDRQITEHRKQVESVKQQIQQPQAAPTVAQPAQDAGQPTSRKRTIDIDGREWLKKIDENPDEALDMLADRVLKKANDPHSMQAQVERILGQTLRQQAVSNEVATIHSRLAQKSPELAQRFLDIGNNYANQGMVVPPKQVESEALFGPVEVQQQLAAMGLQVLLQQQAQAEPTAQGAQIPLAPGMGNPSAAPGATAQQAAPNSLAGTWRSFFSK